jgi:hypothetical protein
VSDVKKPTARIQFPLDHMQWEKIMESWDADRVQESETTLEQHYANAVVKRYADEAKKVENRVSGRLVLARDSRRRAVRGFSGWDSLKSLVESTEYRAQKLRESHGIYLNPRRCRKLEEVEGGAGDQFALGLDASTGGFAPNDEWHPLLLGPFHRNQYLYDFLDQASKSYEAYNHNPVMKAAVNIGVQFVMGNGVKIVAANPAVQEVVDRWIESVESYGTSFQDKLRMLYKDASVIGETFLYAPVTVETGFPIFKYWDATTVWEIVTDPRDIENVHYAYRQFTTQYQLPLKADPEQKSIPISEYVIEQVPPESWLHIKANATVGEKRGRSDLFAALGWGKRFKDWFTAATINAQISNAFVMWWKVNGSQDDVDALRNNADFSRVPPPGTALFTNDQVIPNLLRPQGGTGGGDKIGEQLLAVIATSMNLPPEYLGVGGGTTRATALTRSEPVVKHLEQRQQLMREVITWMVKRVIRCAKVQGKLPGTQPTKAGLAVVVRAIRSGDWKQARAQVEALQANQMLNEPLDESFEVVMPDLYPEDRSIQLRDLSTLRATRVLSQESYSRQAAEVMDLDTYDFNEEQGKMEEEARAGVQSMNGMMPGAPGGPEKIGAGGGAQTDGQTFGTADDNRDYRRQAKEKPAL